MIFASCAFSLGISLIVKVVNLPPVVLALILGTAIGELLDIESRLRNVSVKLQGKLQMGKAETDEKSVEGLITLLVLFSASANVFIGSLCNEPCSSLNQFLIVGKFASMSNK